MTDMGYQPKFVQPGSFSRAYLHKPPKREMQGGRRQTQIFEDKLSIAEVKSLINSAKSANMDPKATSLQREDSSISTPVHSLAYNSQGTAFASPSNPAEVGNKMVYSGANLELPDPPGGNTKSPSQATDKKKFLGDILMERARGKKKSSEQTTQNLLQSEETKDFRKSSRGTTLRRASQVDTAPRRHVRQYRHPREMEEALMDAESKIAILEDKLEATTTVLRRTQQELLKRNADLATAGVKTNSLMLMVRELLQHVTEQREGKRFSESDQDALQKILSQPLDEFGSKDSMKEYIDQKINAIDDLLPKWTSLPSELFDDYGVSADRANSDLEDSIGSDESIDSLATSEFKMLVRNH